MIDAMPSSRDEALGPAQRRVNQYAQLAAVVIIVVGCYLVLQPLIPAVLFAAVVCSATWPLYLRLRKALWGRPALAALAMTLLSIVLLIGPTLLFAASLADNVMAIAEAAKALLQAGPSQAPAWVRDIPLLGELLADYWQRLVSSGASPLVQWQGVLEPLRKFLLGAGKSAGEGLLQLALASFIGFFFYRDGEVLMRGLRQALEQIAGERGSEFLETIDRSVTGALSGIFGTALAQALVALAGFVIAGVPAAFLLSVATFFLSIVPIGPPLVWGGATLWLVHQGQLGWAVFMAVWGFLGISTIDNLVKPYLISRSSNLPMLLIVLGVLGGVVAFGFIGLFIGPPVLAIGLTLVQLWIAGRSRGSTARPAEGAGATQGAPGTQQNSP